MSYEIVIRFPDELRKPLQDTARLQDRSVNSLVRVAVAAWLDSQPAPIPTPGQSASSGGDVLLSPTASKQRVSRAASAR